MQPTKDDGVAGVDRGRKKSLSDPQPPPAAKRKSANPDSQHAHDETHTESAVLDTMSSVLSEPQRWLTGLIVDYFLKISVAVSSHHIVLDLPSFLQCVRKARETGSTIVLTVINHESNHWLLV